MPVQLQLESHAVVAPGRLGPAAVASQMAAAMLIEGYMGPGARAAAAGGFI